VETDLLQYLVVDHLALLSSVTRNGRHPPPETPVRATAHRTVRVFISPSTRRFLQGDAK